MWRTKRFISTSPNSLALTPANPPPKPLTPATPTVRPPASTTVELPLEHPDAGFLETLGDSVRVPGVVIVVAEHGDDRHVDDGQLLDQTVDLLVAADLRQVAGDAAACRPVLPSVAIDEASRPVRVGSDVNVADGGDAHGHRLLRLVGRLL